ncbi:hypothetical protein [Halomicrobium sp. LC1Hm]|uniref:hypothetical protein n=1 Tax=Halomicrobium sp. LC1Hm TaxID=2610902 RepID=UPI00129829D9|nr:hypothetical protein [Halomicrobium sp. LC1Hm]QGA83788.1 Glycosyltransferase [Halomicrobium sp. LC1Hm]
MPSTTRRALLATVATGTVGAVAGCQSLTDDRASLGRPGVTGLSTATLWVGDDVSLPPSTTVDRVSDPSDADLAVYPAVDGSVDSAIETLAADVPVAVVGDDALRTLLEICDGADRPYGFASNGWNSRTDVAGVVPSSGALDTHVFVTADYPDDLPWALGELRQPATHESAVPIEHVPLPENVRELGTARVRGYNAGGEFDRRDRVLVRPGSDPTPVFVDIEATIVAGRRDGPTGPYRTDRVETVAHFDQQFTDVGPSGQTTDALRVQNVSDATENAANTVFTPRNSETRSSFTACQRARVVLDDLSEPFRYTGNVRFRWTDPQLLEDDAFVHHTPGSAVWYPR